MVDRRKTGSKHHLICDGSCTPLRVITTAANVNDITQTLDLVGGIPPVAGRPVQPRRRPGTVLGDKAYDSKAVRRQLRYPRILPVISPRAPRTSRAWASSATSRADLCPAPPVQMPCRPVETLPRTPRCIGLQPHLLETPQEGRGMSARGTYEVAVSPHESAAARHRWMRSVVETLAVYRTSCNFSAVATGPKASSTASAVRSSPCTTTSMPCRSRNSFVTR
ncbi:transposase [Streptomyces albidoflavus]|uniref:transposase n=1 Tax=Streptomyces albidoflavus TaxID=1886 RepID=UPI001165AB87|nr:transposase [Streptomyces albidoflavus]